MKREVRTYGYARVSSADQNLDRQIDALMAFPVDRKFIFSDKASGKDFERPAYRKLMRKLASGDVLVIKSIDRLGRNYREIIDQWHMLTSRKGVSIVVLDMPLLDTRGGSDGITGVFIADLVLQILSYVAQVERENIHQRQAEGIAAAQMRGVRFGRPPLELPADYYEIVHEFEAGHLTRKQAAARLNVGVATFDRWRKRY